MLFIFKGVQEGYAVKLTGAQFAVLSLQQAVIILILKKQTANSQLQTVLINL